MPPVIENSPVRASLEVDNLSSHLHDYLLFLPHKEKCSPNPPLPIGAKRISTTLPSFINKKPENIPPVNEAIKQFKPKRKPKKTKRTVISEDGTQREYEGLLFTLKGDRKWFIIPPDKKIRPLENPYSLNGAREVLARRQVKARPVPPSPKKIEEFLDENPHYTTHPVMYEIQHEEQELFFMAAWYWIRQELLEKETPEEQKTSSTTKQSFKEESPPLCFRELYLNDYGVIYNREITKEDGKVARTCGQVDIFGVLSDSQGVIIDFGVHSEQKELQTLRQYHGMRAVIEENNHGRTPPITVLIGRHFRDEDGTNIVHLQRPQRFPPNENYSTTERIITHNFYENSSLIAD